jgi:hypothetical protein
MYPANNLGTLYTPDDLPDSVRVNWSGRFIGSMSKIGGGYNASGYTLDVQSGLWVLTDTATSTTRTVGNCLIRGDGGIIIGNDLIEDQFPSSFLVEGSCPSLGREGSVICERYVLCDWFGSTAEDLCEADPTPWKIHSGYGASISYLSGAFFGNIPDKWVITWNFQEVQKVDEFCVLVYLDADVSILGPDLNTPVGSYIAYYQGDPAHPVFVTVS